jgi:predicted AAA+ superfamily ATPase
MHRRTAALLDRLEGLLGRLEQILPPPPPPPDWSAPAFRWQADRLEAVHHPHRLSLDDLLCMDAQKAEMVRNTEQLLAGRAANNVLLWGARGTGKSSLIKALLDRYRVRGLRLVEVDKDDLLELPRIVEWLRPRPERFVLFCDDLSFEADDARYKALKAALDGSLVAPPENLLIYASSNRRHLLPEFHSENQDTRLVDGEIHPGEAVEEKISLSERFGLWLSFYPYTQDQYLQIVRHWLERLGAAPGEPEELEQAALRWALHRGSRSGRVAWQFARDRAGRLGGD